MKRLINLSIITFLMLCLFAACSDDDNNEKTIEVPEKEQLNQTVYADDTQGKSGVTFTTTGAWTSSITETTQKSTGNAQVGWVSINPDRGDKADKYTISISLSPNYTGIERSATITIICGSDKIEIKITQADKTATGETPEEGDNVDVYVAGLTEVSGKSTAMYWKNRTPVILGQYDSSANDITVLGNDVYVAGVEKNGNIYDAVYWINGKKMVLGDGVHDSHAEAIHAVGKDIYIVGYERRSDEYWGQYEIPKYWKNGIEIPLSLDFAKRENNEIRPYSFRAIDITSSGNDIYIVAETPFNTNLVYWKNTEVQFIPIKDSYSSVYLEGIAVAGTDVYLAGSIYVNQYNVATYWKNNTEVRIGTGNIDAIYISDKDIYIAGSDGENACYWKNGTKTTFSKNDITSFSSIYVLDNVVYLCGDRESDDAPIMTGKYWINKKMYSLEKYSTANSIFVVKK